MASAPQAKVISRMHQHTHLDLKLVGDISGEFVVPDYQRGYRWGSTEVRLLLSDIWDNGDQNYCLQPVVVKKRDDGTFELVDGQQRLTTLYLVFLYIKKSCLQNSSPPFTITYETRARSAEYLATLDEGRKNDNVDFFHMHNAYECIEAWFEKKFGPKLQWGATKFFGLLFERVTVIWYEASPEVDSTALFTRLNVGRIPLTNAELVRALLLQQSSRTQPAAELDLHRRIEIASQWDLIEREMHDPSFWAFLTNHREQDYPTRIELLFDMMAGTSAGHERFQTFFYFKGELEKPKARGDDEPRAAVWRNILERYYLLKEWYEDRHLYHKVGFLVAIGASLAALVLQAGGCTKSAFHAILDARIRDVLDLTREGFEELSYEHQWDACSRALLLFNVETMRTLGNSADRYPFDAHKREAWTLEHIHAQNAEPLNTKEQWQEWLREHRAALEQLQIADAARRSERQALLQKIDAAFEDIDREGFARLTPAIISYFDSASAAESVHSIANLALLSDDANSAFNNSVFAVKRRRMLALDRAGAYIPICTRRVFLKYYTAAGEQQLHLWSPADREAYMAAMISEEDGVLVKYLKPSTKSAA